MRDSESLDDIPLESGTTDMSKSMQMSLSSHMLQSLQEMDPGFNRAKSNEDVIFGQLEAMFDNSTSSRIEMLKGL